MTAPNESVEAQQAVLAAFIDAVNGREAAALVTVVKANHADAPQLGAKLLLWSNGRTLGSLGPAWDAQVLEDAKDALINGQPQALLYPKTSSHTRAAEQDALFQVYVEVVRPPTLLVVGAGHIGGYVAQLGTLTGFRVVVLDDRADFANVERLPYVDEVICDDFVETLRRFPIAEDTYIVVVTRGHKQDEASLREVVGSAAAYVGMIGSRRRASAVLKLLRDSGVPQEHLDRIRTPIGLDIRAETPEEIAVSIVAELILERRGGTGQPLSQLAAINSSDS